MTAHPERAPVRRPPGQSNLCTSGGNNGPADALQAGATRGRAGTSGALPPPGKSLLYGLVKCLAREALPEARRFVPLRDVNWAAEGGNGDRTPREGAALRIPDLAAIPGGEGAGGRTRPQLRAHPAMLFLLGAGGGALPHRSAAPFLPAFLAQQQRGDPRPRSAPRTLGQALPDTPVLAALPRAPPLRGGSPAPRPPPRPGAPTCAVRCGAARCGAGGCWAPAPALAPAPPHKSRGVRWQQTDCAAIGGGGARWAPVGPGAAGAGTGH